MGTFGWSYPPGADSDPYAPYNEMDEPPQCTTARRNTAKLFAAFDAKDWYAIYRNLYDNTECGVTLGVVLSNGVVRYNNELKGLRADVPCIEIQISSIVEGVDIDCRTISVDLSKKGTRKTGDIVKRLYAAVQEVEDEAKDIWTQTHGCDDCGVEGDWGYPAINPDCDTCKGLGEIR